MAVPCDRCGKDENPAPGIVGLCVDCYKPRRARNKAAPTPTPRRAPMTFGEAILFIVIAVYLVGFVTLGWGLLRLVQLSRHF